MIILTLIGLAVLGFAKLGNMMNAAQMSAKDHRAEASNLFYMAATDTRRSRIDTYYTQAMAHQQVANEMDETHNDRPSNSR